MCEAEKMIYFVMCFVFCTTISSAAEQYCSASDNVKWNKIKRKCVTCSDCPPGYFRNLTEPYTRRTGVHGHEQCLPCRPCPDGTFSVTGHGSCMKCIVNCTEMNREFDETCSSVQDAKCGSCLVNFEDTYRHTLFPCGPKKALRILKPPVTETNTIIEDEKGDGGKVTGYTTAGIAGGIATVFLLSLVVSTLIIRKKYTLNKGQYNKVNDLSRDNDLEMDATHTDDIVPKTLAAENAVRPELIISLSPPARPEISQQTLTQQPNGIIPTLLLSDGRVVSVEIKKDICSCRDNQQRLCQCKSYKFLEKTLDTSDEYITEVASQVCHDPFPLFRHLGLEDSTLYQENNTRNRDPEKITQKELVLRLLNRWIEIKSTQATLSKLSDALCRAHFHKINTVLNTLQNQNNIQTETLK